MLDAIRRLFRSDRTIAAIGEPSAPMLALVSAPAVAIKSLHWPALGKFAVQAVGESYYRGAIAEIAQNTAGAPAMAFCTARLVPEDSNPHDDKAVAVYIGTAKVGHLGKDVTLEFRAALSRLSAGRTPETTCDAVIVNDQVLDGKVYKYSVELDLDFNAELPAPTVPKYLAVVRRNASPPLQETEAGLFVVSVWLPHAALDDMHKRLRTKSWTTDQWSTVNYYLLNSRGAGLGHKLVSIPKIKHAVMFGAQEPEFTVLAIEGRTVSLSFKRVEA